ncbi:TatD family hydrolase [Akkermansiaceae bacterium]|nr:TatD family hydrolase [Akkermansiaceae bacterium]
MIIDSHCHLVSYKYEEGEIKSILERAQQAGVEKLVTLATNLEDAPKHLALTEQFDPIYACIGIHPCDVAECPDDYMTQLTRYAEHPKCVAIGETGLDYFHPAPEGWTEETYHARQREFLEAHFALAAKLKKNIVIHTRDKTGKASLNDCLDIYAKWSDKVQAVFHCFLGPLENADKIFELGGIISFTGIATFKSATDCSEAAKLAPKGKFMLETDSPYLAPAPNRGKRCEPAYTADTAKHIAALRNESLEDLAAHTSATAEKFYNL